MVLSSAGKKELLTLGCSTIRNQWDTFSKHWQILIRKEEEKYQGLPDFVGGV
jgi:hypothetical protein